MFLKVYFFIIFTAMVAVCGQKCTLTSGREGYCREKDDCFGPFESINCSHGLSCCENSEKSVERCKTYGQYVYRRAYSGALTARALMYNVSECNIEVTPLVVGGLKAKPKEYPHMVAIGYGDNIKTALWMCGGSLITDNYVLSAAHCSLSEGRGPAKFARLGTLNLKAHGDPNRQDFKIMEIINHPKYKPPSRYNDIALYKLSGSVHFNGFVRPACLHTTPDDLTLTKGTATGWGKLDYNADLGSDDLMKVALSFIDYSKCNSSFSSDIGGRTLNRGILPSQICAGELKGGKDTCQGDSGGPLQILNKYPYCTYSLIGITSFGKFCGFKNSPAVYTRVSYYVPWIESIIGN